MLLLAAGTALAEPEPAQPRGELVLPLFGKKPDRKDCPEWGLGPIDGRDPFPLALFHFTIPVETPETTRKGEYRRLGTNVVWANTSALGSATGREFVVDAEIVTLWFGLRYGITERLEAQLDLPVHYMGSGVMDSGIESFHLKAGSSDHRRNDIEENDYSIFISNRGGTTVFERDAGLGDASLGLKYRLLDGDHKWRPALSISAHVRGPTAGTTHLGREGWDFALSACASKRLGPIVLGAGGGAVALTDDEIGHVKYESYAGMGWGSIEVGLAPSLALVAHTTIRTPLLDEGRTLDRGRYYLIIGLRYRRTIELADRVMDLEGWVGVLENYSNLNNTADFGIVSGMEIRF